MIHATCTKCGDRKPSSDFRRAGIGSCGNCIRGLLCQDCNFILGLAKDSTDRLLAAAKYLDVNSQFKIPLELVR
jgi:hypothetical protein